MPGLKAKGGGCGWMVVVVVALEGELLSLGFLSCANHGSSQPRRKRSLQRSMDKEAEQADPCTGLAGYGVIHRHGLR